MLTEAQISLALTVAETRRLMETVLVMYDQGFRIKDVVRHGGTVTVTVILANNVQRVVTI